MLGLSDTSSLSRWEHGLALPSMLYVFHLAQLYHALPHELFDEIWQKVDSDLSLLTQNEESITHNQSFFL